MGPSLRTGEYTAEYGMETSTIALQEKVEIPTILRKLMLTVFWDSQGPVLEHYQEEHNNKQCVVQ